MSTKFGKNRPSKIILLVEAVSEIPKTYQAILVVLVEGKKNRTESIGIM